MGGVFAKVTTMITLEKNSLLQALKLISNFSRATIEGQNELGQIKAYEDTNHILTCLEILGNFEEPVKETNFPIQPLLKLVEKIQDRFVKLSINEEEIIIDEKYTLRRSLELPITEPEFDTPLLPVDGEWLKSYLNTALHLSLRTNIQRSMPMITGINLSLTKEQITAITTDGYQLIKSSHSMNSTDAIDMENYQSITILPATAKHLQQVLEKKSPKLISMRVQNGKINWVFDHGYITSSLNKYRYPDVSHHINTLPEIKITVDKKSLQEALNRMMVILKGQSPSIKFKFSKDELQLTPIRPSEHTGQETIPLENSSIEKTIGFNGKFMLDFLTCIKESEIDIYLNNSDQKPAYIKPTTEPDLLYIIMPLVYND
jgi:DNA polymerase III sliding clamp (beta) subunit (PCNA family)